MCVCACVWVGVGLCVCVCVGGGGRRGGGEVTRTESIKKHTQPLKRKEDRSGIEPKSFCLPS